ncbi:serpin B4-like isoform X2 [Neocloeon triangulifer]|uniref:serpin B4-like isoform X2 n=1 Tax=Neocloeon triangulifer TaxID=2078957 RepID=UPI00286ED557|nr:serpin B4-like isoform X2 [Neocloeon triangulifer]
MACDGQVLRNSSDFAVLNSFGRDFYKVLTKIDGNVIASPLSCMFALGMIHAGVKGCTKVQLAQKLKLPEDGACAAELFLHVSNLLKDIQNVELSLANKAFVADGLDILEEYYSVLQKSFFAEAENLNFALEDATDKINSWVKNRTMDKIVKLFDGKWASPFDPEETYSADFHPGSKSPVKVPMMYQRGAFVHTHMQDYDAQALVLPYAGGDISMVIMLPNKPDGLEELEKKLGAVELREILKDANSTDVELFLPKFKTETTIELGPYLALMGLEFLFEGSADYSGISKNEKLSLTRMVQKAFIEVNEEGTEAAAASGGSFERSGADVRFCCKHPFLYFVAYRGQFSLFGGRVSLPTLN